MEPDEVLALVVDELLPAWQKERRKLNRIDRWARWDHEDPHRPKQSSAEYKEIAARAEAPWGDLVVGSVAQTLYIEGWRRPDAPEDGQGWTIWQANGMDGRQVALNRAVLTYGLAYGTCLPDTTLAGEPMPSMRAISPREMLAVYDDVANDDWPLYAIRVLPKSKKNGYPIRVVDDERVHRLQLDSMSARPTYIGADEPHGAGVCPVVRFKNRFDLEGRAAGEVEPFIPLLGKIDQTSFDRLVVQRFASWVVRYATGMDLEATSTATGETIDQVKLRMLVSDLLTSSNPETKFGTLDATSLDGFISAHDADLRALAAVSQTPAFELLGQMANLSAEALAAAKASQTAKSDERKHTLGEDYEQFIRLACHLAGDEEGAADFEAQVRWKDTSIRSLAQAVDAFGKLAHMLGFPPHLLWSKIPGFTQQDVDEATDWMQEQAQKAAERDPLVDLLRQTQPSPQQQPDGVAA